MLSLELLEIEQQEHIPVSVFNRTVEVEETHQDGIVAKVDCVVNQIVNLDVNHHSARDCPPPCSGQRLDRCEPKPRGV